MSVGKGGGPTGRFLVARVPRDTQGRLRRTFHVRVTFRILRSGQCGRDNAVVGDANSTPITSSDVMGVGREREAKLWPLDGGKGRTEPCADAA